MSARVLLGLLVALAVPAAAQEPAAQGAAGQDRATPDNLPQAHPGGVVTVVARAGQGPGTARFLVTAADGVRLFSTAEGMAAVGAGEELLLPFTLGLPSRAKAGTLSAALLELEWEDGRRETLELAAEVLVLRRAAFRIDQDMLTAPAGGMVEIPYRIRNEGNAPDTFRVRLTTPPSWAVDLDPAARALLPGEEISGQVRARVPAFTQRGTEHAIRLTAHGTDVHETRASRLMVVGEASRVGNLATVPGSLFIGSSADHEGTTSAVALSAAGEIHPGMRATVDLRHVDGPAAPPAFRAAMGGPRLRVGLEGNRWTARAGDLFTTPSLLSGPSTHGRGFEGSTERGALQAEVMAARPWSYNGLPAPGHVVQAGTRYRTPLGTIGVRGATLRRDDGFLGEYQHSGASVFYAYRGPRDDLQVETGVTHVAEDSASVTGPVAQVRYAMSRGRVSLTGRLRTVPGVTGATTGHGSEVFMAGDVGVTDRLSLTGSAHSAGSPRVGTRPHAVSDGASAGLRLRVADRAALRLLGTYRSNEFVGSGLGATGTRILAAGASAPVGGVILEADAQAGQSRLDGRDRRHHNLRLGGRWSRGGDWAWFGLSQQHFGTGVRHTRLDLAGATGVHGAELQAGLNTRVDALGQLRTASFWSAATVPVLPGTRLSVGFEHRGYINAGPWRVSLGATRAFGLPLPVARAPIVSGVVFEDLDGDGVRRPGDPGVANVDVMLGGLRTTTDAQGRFRFYDSAGGDLRIDPGGLPMGVTVGTSVERPARGQASIPLVRTASLEVLLVLDRNDHGAAEPGAQAAAGLLVSIRDRTGSTRDAISDGAGRVRFAALPPGTYTVVVQRRTQGRSAAPIETTVDLSPGASELHTIGIPVRTREIRLPNGASLTPDPAQAGPGRLTLPAARFHWLPGALALLDQSGASANCIPSDLASPCVDGSSHAGSTTTVARPGNPRATTTAGTSGPGT